jgi:putative sigma-54 modulation protein
VEGVFFVQVSISARHGHLAPATQEKISSKVEKLRKYHERTTAIQVTVDLEHRDSPSVEIKVSVEHTVDFVATETADNVLAALDSALHKVETQLRKHREKQTGHRLPGHKHQQVLPEEGE